MQLGIGTVQFGLKYGVANTTGIVPERDIPAILELAHEHGIRVLDTAAAYGDSEAVLGRSISGDMQFRVITKLPALRKNTVAEEDIDYLRTTFGASLKRLHAENIDGLLLHAPSDLFLPGGAALYELMYSFTEQGYVKKIGVSVYSGEEIDRLLSAHDFDIIQLPMNVLDQRLVRSGHIKKLKDRKIEIHTRSVFLQGLLLMPLEDIHPYFMPILPTLKKYHMFLKERGITPLEGAFLFMHGEYCPDIVLTGIDSLSQLEANIAAFRNARLPGGMDFGEFAVTDETMVNPQFWKLGI